MPRNVEECILAARSELARRRGRREGFTERYFGEPAWNILLETYLLTVEGRGDIMMKHLAEPSQAPPTTFSRYVDWLESEGDLAREKTEVDKRYTLVRLTPQGRSRIETSLSAMIREEEKFIAPHRFDRARMALPLRSVNWEAESSARHA